MELALDEAVRRVLRRADGDLCARQVAERVTCDTGTTFGDCGPETEDVAKVLMLMPDVEQDFDDDESSDGEVYRLKDAANGGKS